MLAAVRTQLQLRLQEVEARVASSTGEYEALRKLAAEEELSSEEAEEGAAEDEGGSGREVRGAASSAGRGMHNMVKGLQNKASATCLPGTPPGRFGTTCAWVSMHCTPMAGLWKW